MNSSSFKKISIEQIEIGMTESVNKVITKEDIIKFADISGDTNPIHLSESYAETTRYKKNIAHGLMCTSYFSGIFGTKLPGLGSIYVSQNINFKRPIYIGDEVIVTVKVVDIDEQKKRVKFTTQCFVDSKICIDGIAEIYLG